MWHLLTKLILGYKKTLITLIIVITICMGYLAKYVELDYEFLKAVPKNNTVLLKFQNFKKQFSVGSSSEVMLLGLDNPPITDIYFNNQVFILAQNLKKNTSIESVFCYHQAVSLEKNEATQSFVINPIFDSFYNSKDSLLKDLETFYNIPIYNHLIYNKNSRAWIFVINLKKDSIYHKNRNQILNNIENIYHQFEKNTNQTFKVSGVPYIRTVLGKRLVSEMILFLAASIILSIICLFIFFRSWTSVLMSLGVVCAGVIWSLGFMVIFNYKITLLTSLIPPLIVVIGVPNCIYFLNKYHLVYLKTSQKMEAIRIMISKMTVVTFTCNLAAAIGLGVFAFTASPLLYEFGIISALTIMSLFFISLCIIPPLLEYTHVPTQKELKYLENKWVSKLLLKIEKWTSKNYKTVLVVSITITLVSALGFFKLKANGFVIDDLPKNNILFKDIEWFDSNFGGVLTLDMVIDGHKPKAIMRSINLANQIDEFNTALENFTIFGKPLSYIDALKYMRQVFYNNDSQSYAIPTALELSLISPYLKHINLNAQRSQESYNNFTNNLIDSLGQSTRIRVAMKDVGTKELPKYLDSLTHIANTIFDTSKFSYYFTGGSVTFLVGNKFINDGLLESIIWALVLISICMLFLFRSFKILLCSLIPNIIPLIITGGLMGWFGIFIKPSTVLIFSVSLGIVIDITIRFLINFQQEWQHSKQDVDQVVSLTIKQTGLSILYTSIVLMAGFIIFTLSDFSTIYILGWLTSLTLLMGTITNLILLPVLIKKTLKPSKNKNHAR